MSGSTAHAGGHFNPLPRDDEIRSGRRRYAGFVKPAAGVDLLDAVKCPGGHHVPRPELAQFPESGYYTCRFREPPGDGRPCNRRMLVLHLQRVVKDSDGKPIRKLYIAEMDWREFRFLESQGITDVFEMLAWLGESYDPPPKAG